MSIEAMKQALDCLQTAYSLQQIDDLIPPHAPVKQAVAALRQAIEQAEKQEPVKMVAYNCLCGRIMKFESVNGIVAPQREWVGLTEEDINEVLGSDIHDEPSGLLDFVRAIEAKLRSKNT